MTLKNRANTEQVEPQAEETQTQPEGTSFDDAFERAKSEAGPMAEEASDPEPQAAKAEERSEEASDPNDVERRQQQETMVRFARQGEKYDQFLRDLEQNPALRKHVLSFWEPEQGSGPGPVEQAPEDDNPFSSYPEEDQKALSKFEQRLMSRMDAMLAPFRDQMARQLADGEFSTLATQYPDWEQTATKKELGDMRRQFPQLSLLAAYRLVAFDKVRAKVGNADRQMAKVSEVLNRKRPAESEPRRHVKVDRRDMSWEEAFDKAYSQMRAAAGAPGR